MISYPVLGFSYVWCLYSCTALFCKHSSSPSPCNQAPQLQSSSSINVQGLTNFNPFSSALHQLPFSPALLLSDLMYIHQQKYHLACRAILLVFFLALVFLRTKELELRAADIYFLRNVPSFIQIAINTITWGQYTTTLDSDLSQ